MVSSPSRDSFHAAGVESRHRQSTDRCRGAGQGRGKDACTLATGRGVFASKIIFFSWLGLNMIQPRGRSHAKNVVVTGPTVCKKGDGNVAAGLHPGLAAAKLMRGHRGAWRSN